MNELMLIPSKKTPGHLEATNIEMNIPKCVGFLEGLDDISLDEHVVTDKEVIFYTKLKIRLFT